MRPWQAVVAAGALALVLAPAARAEGGETGEFAGGGVVDTAPTVAVASPYATTPSPYEVRTDASEEAALHYVEAKATQAVAAVTAHPIVAAAAHEFSAKGAEPGEAEGHGESEGEEHGEGGEGEGEEHGEGHEAKGSKEVTITAACCLLGMMASIQVLFYLTNSPFVMVRIMTWRMVSSSTSIFAAVLVFASISEILEELHVKEFFPFWRLIVMWIISQGMLYHVKGRELPTAAVATLWGHMTGFFAISSVMVSIEKTHDESSATAMVKVMQAAVVVVVLSWITMFLRFLAAHFDDGEIDEEEEVWFEKCQDYEDDVITVCLGSMFALMIRASILGHFLDLEEDPKHGSVQQIVGLNTYGWVLGAALLIVVGVRAKVVSMMDSHHAKRAVTVMTNLFGMTCAWTLLLGFRWQYLPQWTAMCSSLVPAKLLLALMVSFGAVLVILVLNIATKLLDDEHDPSPRTLRSIMNATGLLVGLSWEETFETAIDLLAENPVSDPLIIKVCLSCALFLIVFPSWQWYILPRSDSKLAKYLVKIADDSDSEGGGKVLESGSEEDYSTQDEEEGEHRGARKLYAPIPLLKK